MTHTADLPNADTIPDAILAEGLGHLEDCFGDDIPENLSRQEIVEGVERHYEGGWEGFMESCMDYMGEDGTYL